MRRMLACVVLVLSAVSMLVPSTVSAGGWAVGSLDPVPPVRAGRSIDVGFRLLQHGRTPVVASEWPGATIGLGVRADGREWFVEATTEGEPGHYVATFDVPADVAALAVAVQMHDGLQVAEEWADVSVQVVAADGGTDSGRLPRPILLLLAALAAGCAVVIAAEVRSMRRRRGAATVPST